nr:transposase [uncultured Microbacterium sp.]
MSAGPSLTDTAAELYTAPLAEFVSRRNARAKETSDAALAAAIRGLRKPSVAAWAVNVFARERVGELGEALQLAQELREAQDDLDAKALAQLGRDRRALTNQLAGHAAKLAESRGERITAATLEAIRQTIGAAFFDPVAAGAVASGRLIRELEPGSVPEDSAEVVAGGGAAVPELPEEPVDEVAARRERKAAQRSLRDAEQASDRSQKAAAKADRELRDAELRADEDERRVHDLEVEIAKARRDADHARSNAKAARENQAKAARAASESSAAVEEARARLDELDNPQ